MSILIQNDRRLHYHEIGAESEEGQRSALVALHGGPGFTHRTLRPWLDPLADPYRVVYLDLPGCGRSSRHPESGYPMEAYVDDVERLRLALDSQQLILLGHGWGAMLAVEYALAHPRAAQALVLINPLLILRGDGQDNEAQARMVSAVDPDATQVFVDELWPQIQRALSGEPLWASIDAHPWWPRMWRTQFVTPPPPAWDRAVDGIELGMESYFAHKGAAMMDPDHPLASYDLAERAQGLHVPTLILAADSDANYVAPPRVHAEPLHSAIESSQLELISNAGHFLFVEAHEPFTNAVLRFLG